MIPPARSPRPVRRAERTRRTRRVRDELNGSLHVHDDQGTPDRSRRVRYRRGERTPRGHGVDGTGRGGGRGERFPRCTAARGPRRPCWTRGAHTCFLPVIRLNRARTHGEGPVDGHPREARPLGRLPLGMPNLTRISAVASTPWPKKSGPTSARYAKAGPSVGRGGPLGDQVNNRTARNCTVAATATTMTSKGIIVCGRSSTPSAAGPSSSISLMGPLSGRALYRSAS